MNTATWYKIKGKDGEKWGVKVRHEAKPGERVEVTNAKGETKIVILGSRAAKFDDAELWHLGGDGAVKQEADKQPEPFFSDEEEPF
jgi:hypothetical protein